MLVDELDKVIHLSVSWIFHGLIVFWYEVDRWKAGYFETLGNIIRRSIDLSHDEIRLTSVALSEFGIGRFEFGAMATPGETRVDQEKIVKENSYQGA